MSLGSPLNSPTQQKQPPPPAVAELHTVLKKEVSLLRDEVRVRDQMLIATANLLHRANEELMDLRTLKAKQAADDTESLTAEISDLKRLLAEKDQTMHDWRQKVKEAIKENKRKEQAMAEENRDLKSQIADLQATSRELQFLKRARAVEKTDQEVQTVAVGGADRGGQSDYSSVEARLGSAAASEVRGWVAQAENSEKASAARDGSLARPLTVILTPPSRRNNQKQRGRSGSEADLASPDLLRHGEPHLVSSPLVTSDGHGEIIHPNAHGTFTSPPPKVPEIPLADLKNAPPIIVAVFYGTADGWTVDTKLCVEPGQTVADLIVITCEKINARYGKKLDAATMCLRTHHPRAQRWVTIRDHRPVHSFAYFLRCASQSESIKLQLEPLTAAEMARRQQSGSRDPTTSVSMGRSAFDGI